MRAESLRAGSEKMPNFVTFWPTLKEDQEKNPSSNLSNDMQGPPRVKLSRTSVNQGRRIRRPLKNLKKNIGKNNMDARLRRAGVHNKLRSVSTACDGRPDVRTSRRIFHINYALCSCATVSGILKFAERKDFGQEV